MIRSIFNLARRRIVVDVDTQRDFLLAASTTCVRNHRRVLGNIRRVSAWTRRKNIRVISTVQIHPGGNAGASYSAKPGNGQLKVSYTLRKNHRLFTADDSTDLPRDVLRVHDQVVIEKRTVDPFREPRLDRLLSETRADEFIVIGAGTETAVKATVLGLLQRKKKVAVVVDAIGSYDKKQAEFALRQMKAKGARLVETKSLAGLTHLKLVRACPCERCRGLMRKQPISAGSE
jgi:nicotinamidase-related amidase